MTDVLRKKEFCLNNKLETDKPILLWIPHFQFELSSLPFLWDSLFEAMIPAQWILYFNEKIDSYFYQQMGLKVRQYPNVQILSHGLETLVDISQVILCDRYSWLPKEALKDKKCLISNSPHQELFMQKNHTQLGFSVPIFDHKDSGIQINHISEMKSRLLEIHWDELSRRSSSFDTRKIHFWIAPPSLREIQEALEDPLVDEVVLYQSRLSLGKHAKLIVLSSPQDLLHYAQSHRETICLIQFQAGRIQGDYWNVVLERFINDDSMDMAGPLCISGTTLAKVHHHIKMEEYHLQNQVTPDALASFIRTSNRDEQIFVPEIDSKVLFARSWCLEVLANQGLKEMLQSPRIKKVVMKDLLLPV